MSGISRIGGCASYNGIIFINTDAGKVIRGIRRSDGTVSIQDLKVFSRVLRFYHLRIEKQLECIPVLRELFKVVLMLGIALFSSSKGILEYFSLRGKWTLRKPALLLASILGIFFFVFSDSNLYMIFFILIPLLSLKEINDARMFHGAEHKIIHMAEELSDLSEANIETARDFSRIHPRCGTNLMVVLIPLIILYSIAEAYFLPIAGEGTEIAISILIMVAGLEVLKLLQKRNMNWILKVGGLLQKYGTTREPEDEQLQLALQTLILCSEEQGSCDKDF
ncbi:MAG: DUF1385 domain-containing protein [Clostridia bacterium]|nr:DUF1385 domain-containing protein [Clostridia bacterium]